MNKHSGGKNTSKVCISDLCKQTNKQWHGPLRALARKEFSLELQLGLRQKCNYRKSEPSSHKPWVNRIIICCFETVRHLASAGTSEQSGVSGFKLSVEGLGREGLDRLPRIPFCLQGEGLQWRDYT